MQFITPFCVLQLSHGNLHGNLQKLQGNLQRLMAPPIVIAAKGVQHLQEEGASTALSMDSAPAGGRSPA